MSAKAPDNSQRQKCYIARDNYYKCLEENENKEQSIKCQKLKEDYDAQCLPSWVKYFERKRNFDKYTKKLQDEGYRETKDNDK